MRRESTASAIATTSTSTTQHGIHNNNNLSSLVSATNASITNAKVGSSMVSSHPTPLILSDRFKRTLINVNHQYPKEIFRKFPAAMAAAIIETCDEEDGGGDGEGEDGSDADEDGLAESAAESTPVTKHAPFNRNQSKGSNNKTNNNNNNNTSKMTTVMDAAAREKLKVIASATQGQVQQSKTKQHSILQSRSPLPSILVRNGGGGGGDASATTQSISSSIGLAAIICTPNRADSHIATRSSYIKPISEKYEDGNNNNNNSNNNTTDSHHDEDGGGSGRGGGGDEGKGQGVNEDELVRYSPFNLQPKSSFNPSTLSKRQLSRMSKRLAAKYLAYQLPDAELVKKIEETDWRARKLMKKEAQEMKRSYLEGKLLLDKRRGQLGNDPRHLEGVESAQNRMKLKLERIMKMKQVQVQSLIEGQINSIDAIALKEFLPSSKPPKVRTIPKSYSLGDRNRVQEILDS